MSFNVDMHTHTIHTDGIATVFDMGKEAFEKGIRLFGISEHAYATRPDGSHEFGIRGDELDAYINDVYTLKDMYLSKMNVMCGLELENLSGFQYIDEFQDSQINYIIGSTHDMVKNGIGFEVDHTDGILTDAVEQLYGGDWYALVRDYFELESHVVENTQCSIIGHFDLITKFNQDSRHFDESSPAYLEPALACLEKLVTFNVPFEINTGAIARGYRKEPYPSRTLLQELNRMGGRITLNSDAHDPLFIGFKYEECLQLARDCGFRRISAITPEGEMELDIKI